MTEEHPETASGHAPRSIEGESAGGETQPASHSQVAAKVIGELDVTDGIGILGHNIAATGTGRGVEGIVDADADNVSDPEQIPIGVRGKATGTGVTYGVEGSTASPAGRGVVGFATSSDYTHNSVPNAASGLMGVTNLSNGHADLDTAVGVIGESKAASGESIGVLGRSTSPNGYGVFGVDEDGAGYGVFSNGDSFTSGNHEVSEELTATNVIASTDDTSTGASAIEGEATATDDENYGVVGRTASTNDNAAGVLGQSTATSGYGQGVKGVAENGIAVEATNNGASGFQMGLWANQMSDSGNAIQALASSSSGSTAGVYGRDNSPDGAGVQGRGEATSGNAIGVLGQTDSPDGYGVYSEDDTRSEGVIEASSGVVHEQRGEPTTTELADGDVMTYNSDGSDSHNAGDLVYAINDGGTILTQAIAAKADAS